MKIEMRRLGMDDLEWMTDLLTEAFLTEVPVTLLFSEEKRQQQTSSVMGLSCAYALLFGECYGSAEGNASPTSSRR
jgi:hypothetical protein